MSSITINIFSNETIYNNGNTYNNEISRNNNSQIYSPSSGNSGLSGNSATPINLGQQEHPLDDGADNSRSILGNKDTFTKINNYIGTHKDNPSAPTKKYRPLTSKSGVNDHIEPGFADMEKNVLKASMRSLLTEPSPHSEAKYNMNCQTISVYGYNNFIIEGNENNVNNTPSSAANSMTSSHSAQQKNLHDKDDSFKGSLADKMYLAFDKYINAYRKSIPLNAQELGSQLVADGENRSAISSYLNEANSYIRAKDSDIKAMTPISRLGEQSAQELLHDYRETQPGISPSQPIQAPVYAPYNSNTPSTVRIDGKDGNNESLPSYITRSGESSVEVYQPSWHLDESGNKIYRPENAFQPPEIQGFRLSSEEMKEDHMVYRYERNPA
jgi:hypothetical protein